MKSIILFTVISACFIQVPTFSQWIKVSPYPTSNQLTDVQFINENNGLAIGCGGTIIRTCDGGNKWSVVETAVKKNLNDLVMINDTIGIIAGNSGTILRTVDGGLTWSDHSVADTLQLNGVAFGDSFNGWAVGTSTGYSYKGYILHTHDGGNTWSLQHGIEMNHLNRVFFTDALNGWAAGSHGIIHTGDGGNTWQVQYSGSWINLNSIFFHDSLTGWATGSGCSALILNTVDGGITWKTDTFNIEEGGNLESILFTDNMNGYIVGKGNNLGHDFGIFLRTINGGANWFSQPAPVAPGVAGISFINGLKGWIVGDYGNVIVSENSGNDWSRQSLPTNDLDIVDVCFVNDTIGWALGDIPYLYEQAVLLYSKDGGKTWELFRRFYDYLKKIFFADESNGWILHNYGIENTQDGGTTWKGIGSPDVLSKDHLFFLDPGNGWVTGWGYPSNPWHGYIYHTPDNGETWELQYKKAGEYFNDILFIDPENGWVAGRKGDSGIILRTFDGGVTWAAQLYADGQNFLKIFFFDKDQGLAVGYNGSVFQTDNGGTTWNQVNPGTGIEFSDVFISDLQHMWATGGSIYYSDDGGISWKEQSCENSYGGWAIWFNDNKYGWVVGGGGTILLTNNGGIQAMEEKNPVGNAYQMKVCCFPNPFSRQTNFEFKLTNPGLVMMTIYDEAGRMVQPPISKSCQSALIRITWNAAGFPVGMYYYTIRAGNASASGKMVIVR